MAKFSKSTYRSKPSRHRRKLVALLVLLLLAAGGAYAYHRHNAKPAYVAPIAKTGDPAKAKSTGEKITPTSGSISTNQGGAVDKQGAGTATTDPSQWTTSSSGAITLQQPVSGGTVKSGDSLRGTAKIDTVEYRLVEDTIGVIAQGSLNVVDGKFSGVLQFKSHGHAGDLKIFSFDPSTGAEINHADIRVAY